MKKFNKNAALKKLDNRNNKKTKKISIIISSIILVITIIYFSFAKFESNVSFTLINGTANMNSISIIDKLTQLKSNGATNLEYDGVDTLGEYGTEDNNLRYVGANPNNYIEFNGELWRIIGVFNNVEDENGNTASRVKIIRKKSLGTYSWDSSNESVNNGYGINQWGESGTYEGADLMRELNTDYLGNITVGTDGKWYKGSNNSKTTMPTSTLNNNAKNMIETVKWNLGSLSNNEGTYDSNWTTNIIPSTSYTRERANTNGKVCTSGTRCNDTVNRTSTWIGKVGLIYPSDYGYATNGGNTTNKVTCLNTSMYNWIDSGVSDCRNNDWLLQSSFQWTLSPFADLSDAFLVIDFCSGGVETSYSTSNDDVFPALYLKNNVFITGGNGTSTNPYKVIQKRFTF